MILVDVNAHAASTEISVESEPVLIKLPPLSVTLLLLIVPLSFTKSDPAIEIELEDRVKISVSPVTEDVAAMVTSGSDVGDAHEALEGAMLSDTSDTVPPAAKAMELIVTVLAKVTVAEEITELATPNKAPPDVNPIDAYVPVMVMLEHEADA